MESVKFRPRNHKRLPVLPDGVFQSRRHGIFHIEVNVGSNSNLPTNDPTKLALLLRLYDGASGAPISFPWGNNVNTSQDKWEPHFEVKSRKKQSSWRRLLALDPSADPWIVVPFTDFPNPAATSQDLWIRMHMVSSFLRRNMRGNQRGPPFQVRCEVTTLAEAQEATWTDRSIEWQQITPSSLSPLVHIIDGSRCHNSVASSVTEAQQPTPGSPSSIDSVPAAKFPADDYSTSLSTFSMSPASVSMSNPTHFQQYPASLDLSGSEYGSDVSSISSAAEGSWNVSGLPEWGITVAQAMQSSRFQQSTHHEVLASLPEALPAVSLPVPSVFDDFIIEEDDLKDVVAWPTTEVQLPELQFSADGAHFSLAEDLPTSLITSQC